MEKVLHQTLWNIHMTSCDGRSTWPTAMEDVLDQIRYYGTNIWQAVMEEVDDQQWRKKILTSCNGRRTWPDQVLWNKFMTSSDGRISCCGRSSWPVAMEEVFSQPQWKQFLTTEEDLMEHIFDQLWLKSTSPDMIEIRTSTSVWQDENITHLSLFSPCDAPVLHDMVVLLLQGLQVLLLLVRSPKLIFGPNRAPTDMVFSRWILHP